MKHNTSLNSLTLIAVCLAIIGSCKDDAIDETHSGTKPSSDQLADMQHYFETTAPTLRQVSFDTPADEHSPRNSPSPQTIADLSPDWDKACEWDAYKNLYIEVPLKGEGLYSRAIFRSSGVLYSYPTRSFLVLVKDKASGSINYHVVTTILERVGHKKFRDEEFRYVGNSELNGFLLFSRVDGTLLKTLHLRNGKSRLLRLENSTVSTRSLNVDSSSNESCGLTLISSTSSYTFKESCDPSCTGSSSCRIVCVLCGKPYCINKGECPNGCDYEVPGDKWKICPTCGADYDVTLFSTCPNCPRPFICPVCKHDPCQCLKHCERCGSTACPGPWVCSVGGGGGNKPVPVAPKAKKLFRNSNMTEENWKKLERMLDKMMKDCMGGNLYNGLAGVLGGGTFSIQFNSSTSSSFGLQKDGSIGISLSTDMESGQLLHEMFHAFRSYREKNVATYNGSLMNGEIEAHYVQYLYQSKLPEYKIKGNKWAMRDNTKLRWKVVKNLKKYIDSHGKLRPGANESLLSNHVNRFVVPALQAADYTLDKYPLDTRTELENFKCLAELTKDC